MIGFLSCMAGESYFDFVFCGLTKKAAIGFLCFAGESYFDFVFCGLTKNGTKKG
jgi:hypothetical protein